MKAFELFKQNVLPVLKYMYKDIVDRYVHIIIVIGFWYTFFTDQLNIMGTLGILGLYAFHACYRQAYWKLKLKKKLEELGELE